MNRRRGRPIGISSCDRAQAVLGPVDQHGAFAAVDASYQEYFDLCAIRRISQRRRELPSPLKLLVIL
jgi:hypothetical protein